MSISEIISLICVSLTSILTTIILPAVIKKLIIWYRYKKSLKAVKIIINNVLTFAEIKYVSKLKEKHKWNFASQKHVYDFVVNKVKLHLPQGILTSVQNYIEDETLDDWLLDHICEEIVKTDRIKDWQVLKEDAKKDIK